MQYLDLYFPRKESLSLLNAFVHILMILGVSNAIHSSKNDRFEKRVRYASRKARADVRRRVKGRFVKPGDAYDYDPLNQTRSC